jgi:hypothetical protein
MEVTFTAKGHPNVRATHKTTLEFTRATWLSPRGDCIIGIAADFDAGKLRELARRGRPLRVTLEADGVRDELEATASPSFAAEDELVIRMGEYPSPRTLAVRSTKASRHLKRDLIGKLQDEDARLVVRIEEIPQ